jgi:fucose permease
MKQTIRAYYGFQFCFGMLLWVPIFYDYQKKMGLSDTEIFGIQSLYYTAFCLLELPTGWAADRFGHRLCMISGAAVLTAANLLAVFAPSYGGFLAHFLGVALARSLISGASSAYLYDSMKIHGLADDYKRVEGNARSYGLIGKVVCWAGIGFLMEWKLSLPYWLTAGFSAAAVMYAIRLPALTLGEPGESKASPAWALADLRPVFASLARSPLLALVMFQGIAMFVLARIGAVNLFQPVLQSKSFPLSSYGLIMSALTIFEAIGSAYPHWLRKVWSDLNSVYVLTAVMGISITALAWAGTVGTVFAFCLFSLACGFSFPIQRQLLNDAIPESRFRATLLSIESLIDRAVCAWVASLLGAYVSGGRIADFLVLSGMASVAAMGLLFVGTTVVRRAERGVDRVSA